MSLRTSRYSPFRPKESQRINGNVSLYLNITDDDWVSLTREAEFRISRGQYLEVSFETGCVNT